MNNVHGVNRDHSCLRDSVMPFTWRRPLPANIDNARSRRVVVHQTSTWPPSTMMTWPVLKPCCIK
jgi:hypothetical protein